MEKDAQGRPAKASAGGIATLSIIVLMLAGSIFYSFPSNVVSFRDGGPVRKFTAQLLPQNWAFFTRPPDSVEMVPYVVAEDGSLELTTPLPNSRRENLYGLTRKQRAQGPELANMANQVTDWTDCDEVARPCPKEAASRGTPQVIENSSPVPTLCGDVVIVATKPVSWSHRDRYEGWRLDDKAALIEARCP
ncbi:SdpA family antimicrobial peptide system protein [Streptomyces pratensis]|uniref:SdpA family antimicrobial peptide system protein n=1 Tax=Streptomyces pratensis TaxID=1169025 RepID=UPI0030164D1F